VSFSSAGFGSYFNASANKFYQACQKLKKEDLKLAASSAIRAISKLNIKSVKLDIVQGSKELNIQDLVEGLVLGNYSFTKYKSKAKKLKNFKLLFVLQIQKKMRPF
ncbi:MAG: M17 family peptidase N-terminal domain-containing protein, partial [Poseidonibacter sp.]